MNRRGIAAEYRLAHWTQVIREQTDRRVSIREYCAESGIYENTYFCWQRKLRESACTRLQSTSLSDGKPLVPKGWTALNVTEEPDTMRALTVEVGVCRIKVLADTDTALLANVCRALKAL
jgi:putative transposase